MTENERALIEILERIDGTLSQIGNAMPPTYSGFYERLTTACETEQHAAKVEINAPHNYGSVTAYIVKVIPLSGWVAIRTGLSGSQYASPIIGIAVLAGSNDKSYIRPVPPPSAFDDSPVLGGSDWIGVMPESKLPPGFPWMDVDFKLDTPDIVTAVGSIEASDEEAGRE